MTSATQIEPSGAAAIADWYGENHPFHKTAGEAKSVTDPLGVMRISVRTPAAQRFPSAPATIVKAWVELRNRVIAPVGVIRPIRGRSPSVNQMLPSGPAVIP